MYTSMNFATRSELARAVAEGLPVVVYSPILGTPEFNGRAHVEGPWFKGPGVLTWKAEVEVKDMHVMRVLPDWRYVGGRRASRHGKVKLRMETCNV